MGAVFKARELSSGREVAVKLVLQGGPGSETRWARFVREGELAASLNHPGIVRVHSAGTENGRPYLVYELIEECRTLSEAAQGLAVRERVRLLRDAALGLGAAHALGIVHRDVKPGNILVDSKGDARVTDFGLATALDLGRLTHTGVVLGTPTHMAPEQVAPEGSGPPTPATDVWALGVILYWLMTEELPFEGSTWIEMAVLVVAASPTPPRTLDPSLAVGLEAVCLKCLRFESEDRYPDGASLARDLDAYLDGRDVDARPLSSVSRFLRRRNRPLLLAAGLVGFVLGVLALASVVAHGPNGSSAVTTPVVHLMTPRSGFDSRADTVRLRGRVTPVTWGAIARVGTRTWAVKPGERFSIEVSLEPGENRIAVQAVSTGGEPAGEEQHLLVHFDDAPKWFHDLPNPPPRPLPKGLRIGDDRGEFVARDGSVLVWVPPIEFEMGVSMGVPDQMPMHPVRFVDGYFIGKYELTVNLFRTFIRESKTEFDWFANRRSSGEHPVVWVSWDDARAYCAWAGLRLPSEAEWEYAARGQGGAVFPWGDTYPKPGDFGFKPQDSSVVSTQPIGSYPKDLSSVGCYDLGGNVSEWVADWYEVYPDALQLDPRVVEPPAGKPRLRLHRGGAFCNSAGTCRLSVRHAEEPDFRGTHLGFRVACSPR